MWILYVGHLFNTNDISYVNYYKVSKLWWVTIHFKNGNGPDIGCPYDTEDEAVEAMRKLQKQFNGN